MAQREISITLAAKVLNLLFFRHSTPESTSMSLTMSAFHMYIETGVGFRLSLRSAGMTAEFLPWSERCRVRVTSFRGLIGVLHENGTLLVGMASPQEFEGALAAVLQGPLSQAALDRVGGRVSVFAPRHLAAGPARQLTPCDCAAR